MSRAIKALILASGRLLTVLAQLVVVAILARLLTRGDYATYRQSFLVLTFVTPIVILGLDRSLYYFLPNEKDRPRGVLVENLLLLTLGGAALGLFIVLGGNHLLAGWFSNPDLATTLLILAPFPLFMLPSTSLAACLMARDRPKQVAAFNVISRIAVLLVVVPVCFLWPDPTAVVTAMVAVTMVTSVVGIGLMLRSCPGDWRPTLSGFGKHLRFGAPVGLAGLAATISLGLDKVLVSAYTLPDDFAIYVNGALEIPLMGIVTSSVTSVLLVDYAKLFADGKISEIVKLIRRSAAKCAAIIFPVMMFLMCTAPEVMKLIYGDRYAVSAPVFRVYLLILPVRIMLFGAILQATGNSHHILIQSVACLVANAILSWCAIQAFGPIGAAYATVCVLYFVLVPYSLFATRIAIGVRPVQLFASRELLGVATCALIPAGALLALSNVAPLTGLEGLVRCGIIYSGLLLLSYAVLGIVDLEELIHFTGARLRGVT